MQLTFEPRFKSRDREQASVYRDVIKIVNNGKYWSLITEDVKKHVPKCSYILADIDGIRIETMSS